MADVFDLAHPKNTSHRDTQEEVEEVLLGLGQELLLGEKEKGKERGTETGDQEVEVEIKGGEVSLGVGVEVDP